MCMQASSSCKMTTFTAWVCVFFVLCASIVKAKDIAVDIEPKRDTAARNGEEQTILCKVPRQIDYCRMELPRGGVLNLKDSSITPIDGITYFGTGLKAGQCGIRISHVNEHHDGVYKCTMGVEGLLREATQSVRIIVAKPPDNPKLEFSRSGQGTTEQYKHGEKLEISCSAPYGRPAANVSLYFDGELMINDERTTVYNQDDISTSIRNASRTLDWTDNGKQLKCVAGHIALDKPKETEKILWVEYPPQPQKSYERFGYVIGRQGVINVTVYANPQPEFAWRVNGEIIYPGYTDQSNRLQSSSPVQLRNGEWSLIMTIDNVQKSDTEKEYVLEARNNEGSYEYRITLSTSSDPAGALSQFVGKISEHMHALVDLDAGSIIGIVVGVLVLVLIIFIVIFARATGRWCFAARRRGDEEAAGDVGAGSEAHITPGDEDDEDHEDPRIIDEKVPHGGQENPIHASNEYVNGRADVKDVKKDEKTDTPV